MMIEPIAPHSMVIVNLVNPKEKFWGMLVSLSSVGLTLHGINLDSFEDWIRQVAGSQEQNLDLVTMFVPLFRVERMFLDQPVGVVMSYSDQFRQIVGLTPEEFLGVAKLDA